MKALFTSLALVCALLMSACGGSDKVEIGNKTSMQIDPVFDAGEVIKGEEILATFKMKNTGDFPLVVAAINGSCTCTVTEKPEDPILPGEEYTIKATVDTERTGLGSIAKGITIVANTEPSMTQIVVKAMVMNK